MKRFTVLLLVTFSVCSMFAQQNSANGNLPPTTQQVMKYFEIMHLHDQMNTLLQTQQKQLDIMLNDMFNKQLPQATPAQRVQFQTLMKEASSDMFSNYPIDDALRDMVPVYQRHLTESDMNAIIAFYSSPAGKKVIQEMPSMTAEAMRVSYTRLQPKFEEMMKKMDARLQEMAKEEQNLDATPDSSTPKN